MTTEQTPQPPPRLRRKRPASRVQRWLDAASGLTTALNELNSLVDQVENAAGELRAMQEEFENWRDNLPENLQSSPLGEKLEEVCSLEIEDVGNDLRSALDDAIGKAEEFEAIDLPLGFGRD